MHFLSIHKQLLLRSWVVSSSSSVLERETICSIIICPFGQPCLMVSSGTVVVAMLSERATQLTGDRPALPI